MTEKTKKMSEILKESIERLETNLKNLEERQKQYLTTSMMSEKHDHTAMPDSARGHKTIEEVSDCPTCKQKLLDKYRPELFKEFKDQVKAKKIVKCVNCGELEYVTNQECPTCKGREARSI
jgi:hypothetical protein